jgi:DNA-binding FadR family transcriptional regulator
MAKPAPRADSHTGRRGNGPAAGVREARRDGSKLAAFVADRIIDDIAARGWPEGEVVGSEAELLDRYRVSRAVFREAVRLLEHLHVARMRRGPGGGLVVSVPTADSVTDAVTVYAVYVGAQLDEVFEARLVIEELAAELAAARLDQVGIEALRAQLEVEHETGVRDIRELHSLVGVAAGNPALAFFVDLLSTLTSLFRPSAASVPPRLVSEVTVAHGAIVDAIASGDGGLAKSRMRAHIQAEARFLQAKRPARPRLTDLPDVVGRSEKRAEQTARQIFREVARDGWPVGALLGSESELMTQYGVSRAVLREAVRVLEHHQVARMRRGPGGGLFVVEPGIEAVADAIALQIDRLGIKARHLYEVRSAVEMAALEMAVTRLDSAGEVRVEAALEAERVATGTELQIIGHDLHGVLAGLSGNRVIELLALVLVRLSRIHASTPNQQPVSRVPTEEVVRSHQKIVESIRSRDLDLARRRMRQHLDAVANWSR